MKDTKKELKKLIWEHKWSILKICIIVFLSTFILNLVTDLKNGDINSILGDDVCKYKSPTNSTNDIEYLEKRSDGNYCCADVTTGFINWETDDGSLSRFLHGKEQTSEKITKLCNKVSNK